MSSVRRTLARNAQRLVDDSRLERLGVVQLACLREFELSYVEISARDRGSLQSLFDELAQLNDVIVDTDVDGAWTILQVIALSNDALESVCALALDAVADGGGAP